MENQLVLFEVNQLKTELVAVLGQLRPEQREVATRLLAELMARSVVDGNRERNGASEKGQGDE